MMCRHGVAIVQMTSEYVVDDADDLMHDIHAQCAFFVNIVNYESTVNYDKYVQQTIIMYYISRYMCIYLHVKCG